MIWEDMVGGSRNCPATSSRNFSSPAQDQEKGDATQNDVPHPEERPLGRVSKDGSTLESWFEMREDALPAMRGWC
jgi:hypothetical protein